MKISTRAVHRFRSADRGQVLPLVALSLVVLMGAGALALDVGFVRYQQRAQQIATDSAAVAGGNELMYHPNPNCGTSASSYVATGAAADATLNGYTDSTNNVKIAVNNGPKSGPYAAQCTAVEVIIVKSGLPSFFAPVLGAAITQVATRAVAAINPNALGCVYALKASGKSSGITLDGGGSGGGVGINAPTCGILDAGDLTVNGSNATIDARFLGYNGTYNNKQGTFPEATPTQIQAAVTDPCIPTMYPTCAALATLDPKMQPCVDSPSTVPLFSALPPGRYCYTDFSKTAAVTLAPTTSTSPVGSLYIFDKGMPGSSGTLTGNGVTIYNNGGNNAGWTFNGSTSIVNVSAPSTGPYAGMVYFQPATDTGAVTISGASTNIQFAGGFYAPGANVTMNGSVPANSLLVAGSITVNGGGMNLVSSTSLVVPGHAVLAE